jgi:hypothetical protein
MRLHYKQVLDRVTFPDADHLDRTRVAEEITRLSREKDPTARAVHRTQVSNWIILEKVPMKYVPFLKKIDFDKVSTNRKPFKRVK